MLFYWFKNLILKNSSYYLRLEALSSAGMSFDQGIIWNILSLSFESTFDSIPNKYIRYFSTINSLALAVSIILYIKALAFAPLAVFENNQFFRPITKGFIAL